MTAEELLQNTEDSELHEASNEVFVIDNDLRTIFVPESISNIGVESDDDVNRLYFQMPKQYGEFDLSEFNIRINYMNADNKGDIYAVTDKEVSGDNITFSWLVGRTAFAKKGNVRFIVCLKKTDDEGSVQKEFNTTVATLAVLEGLETSEQIVQENPDIIEEILKRLDTLETTGGGGTSDYNDLDNKPTMNNVEIEGALTGEDVGLIDRNQGTENAGKTLVVGEDGNLVVGDYSGGNVDTEKLLAIAIKPKTSGASPLTAKDSAGFDLLDMSVDGLSEQVSTTGAQLFDAAKAKQLDSWIGTGAYRHFDIQLKSNTTYTLFVARNNMYKGYKEEYNAAFALYLGESENLSSPNTLFGNSASSSALEVRTFYTFTTTEAPYYINLYTDQWREEKLQIAFDELLVNMMLIEGSSVVPYEPYTGGAPSPSPEYPQEIRNSGKLNEETGKYEVEVKLTGTNLFNPNGEQVSGLYLGFPIYNKGAVSLAIYEKNSDIDVSDMFFGFTANGINAEGGTRWVLENGTVKSNGKIYYELQNGYISIYPPNMLETFLERYDVMLNYGRDVYPPYEPHKEQTVTLTSDRPLTKWDRIEKREGVWGVVRGGNTVVLDGSEDEKWITYTNEWEGTCFYRTISGKYVAFQASLMDAYRNINSAWAHAYKRMYGIYSDHLNRPEIYLRPPNAETNTIDLFKTWLQSNPITVQYQLAEPTWTPFAEDIQEQLNSLKTYYPSTTFRVTQNSNLSVQYVADPENYIKNLITPIATQMLNQ